MKQLLLLCVLFSSAIVFFCNDFDKSVNPVEASESGALAMTVHAGTIGALAKTAAIEMSSLYIELSSPGLPTIYDTLSLSGGSAERTERKTYANLASRVRNSIVEWTLTVESRDLNGTIIHSGDTIFTVPPRDTIDIEMFLAAQYSMLVANFYPIRDSVTGCEIKVEGLSKNAVTFDKQSRLGDTVSLTDDYLPASQLGVSQNIEMNVYGHYFGVDTLLYTGDTSLSVVSGQNSNYQIKLKYVGPAALQGAATMAVTLGAVGTVTVDGELEDTVAMNEVVTDIDGNVYHTVTIGTQTWMVENLKASRYNDGTPIPLVTDNTEWAALSTPAYRWYNNDSVTYCNPYGALYNWYVVDPANVKKLAPTGWHVPSEAEWTILETFLGGSSVAGGKLKEAGTTHWNYPNTGATNEIGFSAVAGGQGYYDGSFNQLGYVCYWWSSIGFRAMTVVWLSNSNTSLSHSYYDTEYYKRLGYSVRCLKD
jgi:uncharacterized protein (TIGR02145 family)